MGYIGWEDFDSSNTDVKKLKKFGSLGDGSNKYSQIFYDSRLNLTMSLLRLPLHFAMSSKVIVPFMYKFLKTSIIELLLSLLMDE